MTFAARSDLFKKILYYLHTEIIHYEVNKFLVNAKILILEKLM